MNAAIVATAGAWVAWFAYLVGERVGERRGRVELNRLRRRLSDHRDIVDWLHAEPMEGDR